ncbi:probable DNA base excision repair N-glycosylase 2 [Phialocephala subalpina]|uniref:Endonuclease III homolog n=1 Tax=Phialocephala subalpina TaxID=576137 RepID=A0A1L7WK03_9HELO|nr:probable DNA base excision repair N-glycosylase 2 [Phialocephala subalpina]
MRTSKISQETTKILNATRSNPTRRSTRTSLSNLASSMTDTTETTNELVDIEDAIPTTRKRKRDSTPRTPIKKSPNKTIIKTETGDTLTFSPSPAKASRVRKPARKIKNEETGEVEIHAPNDWAELYSVMKEMRTTGAATNAAVDTMGCERMAQKHVTPKIKRFQTLIALMLSSQTKDTTNAVAMNRLYNELPAWQEGEEKGLTLENILAVDPKLLNELIWVVGFHNNKTKYIKAAAEILRDKWNGDIPDSIEGLMSLPGVGPKMAYLCLSVAWGRTEGIGVDVHVHRITNMWGWNKTKNPEETRLALQAWLPKELWHEINWLMVGLGQTICLPVGRKCGDCELGLRGLCKAAERSKVTLGRKIKEEKLKKEKIKKDEDGEVVAKEETVKIEEVDVGDVVVNAGEGEKVVVDGVPEGDVMEGLIKEEEKEALEDIANAPGELEKTPKKKRSKR